MDQRPVLWVEPRQFIALGEFEILKIEAGCDRAADQGESRGRFGFGGFVLLRRLGLKPGFCAIRQSRTKPPAGFDGGLKDLSGFWIAPQANFGI